jgi:hypothetical protein
MVYSDDDYSPLRHLASIVCPWWLDPKDVILVMLSFAFDAGGSESTPTFTVAGLGSSENDWRAFSEAWSKRLKQDGIAFFRAVDLASFRGPFQHLRNKSGSERERVRRALSSDLMDILKSHVYRKFGCMIINKEFAKMSPSLIADFSLNAYSVAGRTAEKQVREWIMQEWSPTTPVELVFEEGDADHGKLMQRLKDDAGFEPIFRPKKDTVRPNGTMAYGYIPLQAADWLAYEISVAEKYLQEGKIDELSDLRWPMQQFLRIPGEPTIYDEEDMSRFEKGLDLIKKIGIWERKLGVGRFVQGHK